MITTNEPVPLCGMCPGPFQDEQPLSLTPLKSTNQKTSDAWRMSNPAEALCQGGVMNSVDFRLRNIVFLFDLNGFSKIFYMENTHMTTSEWWWQGGGGAG